MTIGQFLLGPLERERDVLARFQGAVARVDALIERPNTPEGKSPAEIRARAEERLGRVRRFLAGLGDPHLAYPTVHVGGTSGKGSTSTAVAAILGAAGYRVGLHTSPYLQVASEKLALGGRLIAPEAFAALVDDVLAEHAAWEAAGEPTLTYGEVWVALWAEWFRRERVDLAVVEVGAGGRFDLTNVVRPAVSVVTSVGLDHTVTLGGTIAEIAWHKAGIVKAGAPAVTAVTDPVALRAVAGEAARVGAPLARVVPGETFAVLGGDADGTTWRELRAVGGDAPPGGLDWPAQPGRFQAANAAAALAAVRALAPAGFRADEDAVRRGLGAARIPGRFETVGRQPRVVLDGAHNPDKVAALAAELAALADRRAGGRLVVVLGAVADKRHGEMARLLVPHADELVATAPRVTAKPGAAAATLAAEARAAGFRGGLWVEPDPGTAVDRALARADALGADGTTVLVTGSLYLVGNVRGRWYPDERVALDRTPWPSVVRRTP